MTEQTLKGSCLCGALQFVVTGEPARFFHCHCSRRRKSTGDSTLIKTYKLPGAQRFARIFQNSKATWSCAGDQVPCFAEYAD